MANLQKRMVRRPAINGEATGSASERPRQSGGNTRSKTLPRGKGNFMISNWAIGKNASPLEVTWILESATFDCVVITLTSVVVEDDDIAV